jgi:hypothetical protein
MVGALGGFYLLLCYLPLIKLGKMMTKEQLFRNMVALQTVANDYIKQIPTDIQDSFFDNGYVNTIRMMNDELIEVAFGEHYPSVEWFLYEWKPGYEVGYDGKFTVINNLDEYIEWMKLVEGFE